ncbi:MAG: 2-C-methyl-D-erythritol 2,4-cyclodiphosphate synthase, partial [Candidatus Peregrinibacteria bacterium]|nr:2-C-methyl-D-erythritol 2,4-cyclodiphosphate synthase [Candidatus Peregrinibacteria bacterium]
ISAGIAKAKEKKNIIFGFFTPNSIKEVDKSGKVNKFLDREQIFETQTPQISDLKTFREAISNLESNPGSNLSRSPEPGFVIPRDEAELLAEIGEDIYIFECSPQNQKMTFAHDFNTNPGSDLFSKFSEPGFENLRIGIGEDSHRFVQEFDDKNPVILGGIKFPECEQSFDANSDGDVILHALCNAILSPVGEKTLDSFADEMCKDGITDSREYLKKALEIVQKKFEGFEIFNVVISLECKMPKIAPRHDEVQESLAELLGIEVDKVGLTYTTGEGLSCFGEGKGVRALVKVLAKI